eukprot:PhM_4_TR14234/c0_g2_i1/m.12489
MKDISQVVIVILGMLLLSERKAYCSSVHPDPDGGTAAAAPVSITLLDALRIDNIQDGAIPLRVVEYVVPEFATLSLNHQDELVAFASDVYTQMLAMWERGEELTGDADVEKLADGTEGSAFDDAVRSIRSVLTDVFLEWRHVVQDYFVVERGEDGRQVLHRYVRHQAGDARYHTASVKPLISKTELDVLRQKAVVTTSGGSDDKKVKEGEKWNHHQKSLHSARECMLLTSSRRFASSYCCYVHSEHRCL